MKILHSFSRLRIRDQNSSYKDNKRRTSRLCSPNVYCLNSSVDLDLPSDKTTEKAGRCKTVKKKSVTADQARLSYSFSETINSD